MRIYIRHTKMDLDEEFRVLVFKYGITNVIEYAENYVKRTYEEINKVHARLFLKPTVEAQNVVEETPIKVEESTKEVVKNVEPMLLKIRLKMLLNMQIQLKNLLKNQRNVLKKLNQ